MLSVHGRKSAAVVIEPLARLLLRVGVSPNTVTTIGTVCACLVPIVLIPTGHLVSAAILAGLFCAFDMIDGTMARMRGGGTKFGAALDASCDRITDGALFGALTWWLVYSAHAPRALVAASLVVLVSSQIISYVKARGEASGFKIVGGLIERPERLIIGLVGIGLEGFGVPFAVDTALYLLAVGSVFTVIQRLGMAARSSVANEPTSAPVGAREFPQ